MRPVDLKDYTPLPLPWEEEQEHRTRLYKLCGGSVGLFLLFFLIVTFLIDPPEIQRDQLEKVPERIAKVMLEKKRQPPPEIKKPKPEPEPEPEKPKPEPEKPKPKPEPKKEKPKPKKKVSPEKLKKAREKASKSGILAMQDQLKALRNITDLRQMGNKQLRDAKAGSTKRRDQSLIGRRALDGSGGIQTTAVAKPGKAELAGRATTRVETSDDVAALMAEAAQEEAIQQRTAEEIKLAFDRSKSAFYSLYRRALRSNLGLQGRVVFELSIAPSGQVTECRVVSSGLDNPDLERKLRARVMLLSFEAKDVDPYTGRFHIDLSPNG